MTEIDEKLLGIEVYPNPATDQLILSGLPQSATSMEVFDAVGKVILKAQPSRQSFDVSDFKNGYYFLQIEGNEGIARIPFVKK